VQTAWTKVIAFASTGHEAFPAGRTEHVLRPGDPATEAPVEPGATFVNVTTAGEFQ
jgi:hypothetical protein